MKRTLRVRDRRRRITWAGDSSSGSRDAALRRRLASRIEVDPAFWLMRGRPGTMIVVDVACGAVTLSGYVRSEVERRYAEAIARQLGAAGVDNRLLIFSRADDYAA